MAAFNFAIVARSGRGKTTSARNLGTEDKKTLFINLEEKALPFRAHEHLDVKEISTFSAWENIFEYALSDRCPERIIFIDSLTDLQRLALQHFAEKTGTAHGKHFGDMFEAVRTALRRARTSKKLFIFTSLEEHFEDESAGRIQSMKTEGKKLSGELESYFTTVFWSAAEKRPEGGIEYVFHTQTDGWNAAKSPMGMFEEQKIPNDCAFVIERIRDYYGGNRNQGGRDVAPSQGGGTPSPAAPGVEGAQGSALVGAGHPNGTQG